MTELHELEPVTDRVEAEIRTLVHELVDEIEDHLAWTAELREYVLRKH